MLSMGDAKKKRETNEIKIDGTFEHVYIAPEFLDWAGTRKSSGSKTYIEWLNKQKGRKDSLGDLVRKFLTDKDIRSWYGFRDHVEESGATEDEMKTCEKSWVEYTTKN